MSKLYKFTKHNYSRSPPPLPFPVKNVFDLSLGEKEDNNREKEYHGVNVQFYVNTVNQSKKTAKGHFLILLFNKLTWKLILRVKKF